MKKILTFLLALIPFLGIGQNCTPSYNCLGTNGLTLVGATAGGGTLIKIPLAGGLSFVNGALTSTGGGGGGGTVTSVSGVTANGFSVTVSNPTTTPGITLSETVTGLLKGNGTAISAAIAGTDYQAPLTLTTTGSSGAATLIGNTLNIPQYSGGSGGTVTTVSVVSANGFGGSVANATTTPAITLTTSITGLLKGNGTAISAASAGTDYQAPITLTTTGTSGAATFTSNTLNIPNYATGGGSGTVTNVATGFGLSGGDITTTGTLFADTTSRRSAIGLPTIYYVDSTIISNRTQASLPSTYIGYGSGSNTLTGSPNFVYNSSANTVALLGYNGIGYDTILYSSGKSHASAVSFLAGNINIGIDAFGISDAGCKIGSITIPPHTFLCTDSKYSFAGVNYVVPSSQGAANTVLTNDGSGNLSWASAGGGSGIKTDTITDSITAAEIAANDSIQIIPAAPSGYYTNILSISEDYRFGGTPYLTVTNLTYCGNNSVVLYTGGTLLNLPNNACTTNITINGQGNIVQQVPLSDLLTYAIMATASGNDSSGNGTVYVHATWQYLKLTNGY